MIEINNENFEKEVVKSEIPVIIDFYADWCGPCKMMKPEFEALSIEYTGKIKFAKLNTEHSPKISEKFGIMGIPCVVITKKGKEIGRVVGFMPKSILKQKIDSLLK